MEDLENVLMELSALEKNPQTTAISRSLDEYLAHVAKTGNALFAWNKVKPLFKRKLEMIIQDFQETSPTDSLPRQPNVEVFKFDQMKERVFEQLESYTGIPFTVQRLCELMVQPKKHYKRTDKFMRGLEKVMLVVSTVDPNPVPGEPEAECEAGASSLETESPSKRIRLSSAQDTEAGPCDSADEAGLSVAGAAVAVEVVPDLDTDAVAGPSRQLGEGGGLERDTEAEAGEESMDIDTECTSSQGRLALAANTSDDSLDTGVESSAAAAQASEASSDSDGMDIESPGRGAEPGTGVASSSGAGAGQPGLREAEEAGLEADTGVSTSLATQHTQHTQETAGPEDTGAASSSGDTSTSSAAHGDTGGDTAAAPDNSEAEPSEATASLEAAVAESEAGSSAEDAVAGEQCSEVASASVQSSDSEASAPRTDPGDSGAADSSDQASVAGPGQDLVTSDQSSISTSEAAGAGAAADTEESGDSPDQSDTAVQ